MSGKATVLIVEPEGLLRRALADALRLQLGAEVELRLAERGDEALRLAQQMALDGVALPLVLTEQLLLGLRGDALIEALHQINPDTRVVVVTAEQDAASLRQLVNQGRVDRLLGKPWAAEALSAAVTDALSAYDDRLIERGRLDLIETAADAALNLAAAATPDALALQLVELAVSYTGASQALLVELPAGERSGGEGAADAREAVVRAALVPERGLFDAGAEGAEPPPVVAAVAAAGGWRRHPSAGSAADWRTASAEPPREAFAMRLYADDRRAWVVVAVGQSRALHRAPAPLFTRLMPWVQHLLPRLQAQAEATQLLTAERLTSEAQQHQLAARQAAHEAERQALHQQLADANLAHSRALDTLAAELSALKDERAALHTEHEQHTRTLAEQARELSSAQQTLAAREAELGVLSAQLEALRTQTDAEGRTAEAERTRLEAELAQVSAERRALLDDLARTTEQLGKTEDHVAELKRELERTQQAAEQQTQQWSDERKRLQAAESTQQSATQAELERQRLAHQEELTRLNKVHSEATQQLQNERNELRNQVLGLTAQLQGAGRPSGQESGPLREQLQALAVKLADTEAQLEDAYRQAAQAAQAHSFEPVIRRYFPQGTVVWRGGRPYAQQQVWAAALDERLMVAVLAAPQAQAALQQLAWLEWHLQQQAWAAQAQPATADPARWLALLRREWTAQQGQGPQPQVGLALFDAEALTLRFAGEGAGLLLWRRGALLPIHPEPAGGSSDDGLLIEADDRFILTTDRTLPVGDRGAWAPLAELIGAWVLLTRDEQRARLEQYVRQRIAPGSEAGYAGLYLSV